MTKGSEQVLKYNVADRRFRLIREISLEIGQRFYHCGLFLVKHVIKLFIVYDSILGKLA